MTRTEYENARRVERVAAEYRGKGFDVSPGRYGGTVGYRWDNPGSRHRKPIEVVIINSRGEIEGRSGRPRGG